MAETKPDTVVYVSNAGDKAIGVLAMDRTSGALTPIEQVAVPGTDQPSPTSMPLAVSPDRRFLYAVLRTAPFPVSSFAIDPSTGRLSHLGLAAMQDSMAYLVTDRTGRFLLGASYPGAKLTVNPIGADGRVQAKAAQILSTQPKAHCILADASNRYVYAPILGGDVILELKFDAATGSMTPNTPASIATRAGAGPRHLAFHPNRRFLYLLCETNATIYAYAVDPQSGTLRELQMVETLPAGFKDKPAAADLHVTPDGRFLYGSERRTSTLTGFRIDADKGTLSPIGRFATEKTPRGFAIDPRSRFLLSVGLDSNAMSVYAIDQSSGALNLLKQYPMGAMPNWVEFVDLR